MDMNDNECSKGNKQQNRNESSRKLAYKTRTIKSSGHSSDESRSESKIHKYIEIDDSIKRKLHELPEVLQFIERLQKVIEKQVKKIIKWKKKCKQLQEKSNQNASTQTIDFNLNNEELGNCLESIGSDKRGEEKEKSLAEDIREAAEQALQSSGFAYEESSGLYYDYNSGYYYNAEYGLYYDGTTGTYLKYNQETKTYNFYSQVAEAVTTDKPKFKHFKSKRKSSKHDKKKSKDSKRIRSEDLKIEDAEEGECSDSSLSCDDANSVFDSTELSKQWPPCMRLIVESTEIPNIKPGTLHVVTCDGGTIGREGAHSICLPDVNVSKHHLKINYNSDTLSYVIVDLGSRNGTFLNGKRISSSKQESEPVVVGHASKLQIGSTTLLCHIHDGTQTCGHCEPGLLLEDEKDPLPLSGRKNLNLQFKNELKRLKKHHGFLGCEEDSSKLADGYMDRAEKRRFEVGSQNPYEKTESASVDESIKSENKGFKLLAKMGWREGESLGKDGTGVKEPIKVSANIGTKGIGASGDMILPPSRVNNNSKQSIWKKTQERFEKLPSTITVNIFNDEGSES